MSAESLLLGTPITIKSPDIINSMIVDTVSNSLICRMGGESAREFDINTKTFGRTMSASTDTLCICADESNIICGRCPRRWGEGLGDIKIYDRLTGKLIKKINHKTATGDNSVYSVVIWNNPKTQNKVILSSSNDDVINMWDLATGAKLGKLDNPKQSLGSTLITGNTGYGRDLLVIYDTMVDYDIDIIDIAANKCIRTLTGHTNKVISVRQTNDGRLLISSSRDKTIRIWDTTNWDCIKTISGNNIYSFNTISVATDDSLLVSTYDKHIYIWDMTDNLGECVKIIADDKIGKCPAIIHDNMIIYGTKGSLIKLIPFTRT